MWGVDDGRFDLDRSDSNVRSISISKARSPRGFRPVVWIISEAAGPGGGRSERSDGGVVEKYSKRVSARWAQIVPHGPPPR